MTNLTEREVRTAREADDNIIDHFNLGHCHINDDSFVQGCGRGYNGRDKE
jgi:hypothetical protein